MNALIAIIPVLLLFILMLGFKVSGYKSALITLIVTACIALWIAPATGWCLRNSQMIRSIPSWGGVSWKVC